MPAVARQRTVEAEVLARPPLGTRPLDKVRSRLGIFRGDVGENFDAPPAAGPAPDAGDVERAFFGHDGRVVHKWHHYLPLYDRYFAPYRNSGKPVRMLEIGVSQGGSLEMWRKYFGPEAVLFGIDIDPQCAAFDGEGGNRIRIGSQDDPAFLRGVVDEMGGVDIVLDDGSHVAAHMLASFDVLFPLLSDGGLYAAEDLHAAYWKNFGGGYHSGGTFISLCKALIDDIHHWYHPNGERIAAARGHVAGIHVHDSIAFIEKQSTARPVKSQRGAGRTAKRD